MLKYQCLKCNYSFSDADRAWDTSVKSGICPKCKAALENFPVPLKLETKIFKPESHYSIAWKWAKWPTFFGVFVGYSAKNDFIAHVSSPAPFWLEYVMGGMFAGMFALALGGSVFCISFLVIKVKNALNNK